MSIPLCTPDFPHGSDQNESGFQSAGVAPETGIAGHSGATTIATKTVNTTTNSCRAENRIVSVEACTLNSATCLSASGRRGCQIAMYTEPQDCTNYHERQASGQNNNNVSIHILVATIKGAKKSARYPCDNYNEGNSNDASNKGPYYPGNHGILQNQTLSDFFRSSQMPGIDIFI